MKHVIFVLMMLFSLKCPALSLETGAYATIHFKKSIYYNHVGDNRTTMNPMIRINTKDFSFYYFKDSINSPAGGINYLIRKNNGRLTYGLTAGGYLIDTNNWNKWKPFWCQINSSTGFIPVLGPEVSFELFKRDKFVLNNHSILSVGGYFSTGIFLEWKF